MSFDETRSLFFYVSFIYPFSTGIQVVHPVCNTPAVSASRRV
jgi:hypothetical protein